MADFPQKLGAILGGSAFFVILIVSLLIDRQSQSLFVPFRHAVFGFLIFIVIGWIIGTSWEYMNRGKSKGDSAASSDQ